MRTEIKNNQRQRIYLEPNIILRYFLTEDDKLNTIIMCKEDGVRLYTTDLGLYTALCCIKPHDAFKINKLTKFLETVDVLSYNKETGKEKPITTHEMVEELRATALKN